MPIYPKAHFFVGPGTQFNCPHLESWTHYVMLSNLPQFRIFQSLQLGTAFFFFLAWPDLTGCWMAAPKSSSLAERADRSFHQHYTGFEPWTFFWSLRAPEWAIPESHHPWGNGYGKIMGGVGLQFSDSFQIVAVFIRPNNLTLPYLSPQESYLNLMMGLNSFELQIHFIPKDQKYCKERFNNLHYFNSNLYSHPKKKKKTSRSLYNQVNQ